MSKARRELIRERSMATGAHTPDTTPVEIPFRRPLTLRQEMQRFIRAELSKQANEQGFATFEEEDDFEEDDPDAEFLTPYSVQDMHPDTPDPRLPLETMEGSDQPDTAPPSPEPQPVDEAGGNGSPPSE